MAKHPNVKDYIDEVAKAVCSYCVYYYLVYIDKSALVKDDDQDPFGDDETQSRVIAKRQSQYQMRARKRVISPERADMFTLDQTPDAR